MTATIESRTVSSRAVAKYVRMSPSKVRRVVGLIRGRSAQEAADILQFAPQAASVPVRKVLLSAMANAESVHQLEPNRLVVAAAYVDEGPTMKRIRPRAQMRAYRIRKRTCHVCVVVEAAVPTGAPSRRSRRGGRRAATTTDGGAA